MNRPSWNTYFMRIAHDISTRSTCIRRQIGAVLVKDNRIIATGYNGSPPGTKHCIDIGCLRDELKVPSGERHELCRAIHAEENAILQCAKKGISTEGSLLYCTSSPCVLCAKSIASVGIIKIIYPEDAIYPDKFAEDAIYPDKFAEHAIYPDKFAEQFLDKIIVFKMKEAL